MSLDTKSVTVLATGFMTAAVYYFFNKTRFGKKLDTMVKELTLDTNSLEEEKKVLPTVIVGPSGVGKGTLLGKLKEEFGSFAVAVSHTTRAPRPGETDGISYNFVTREEFKTMIENGGFIEHAEFGGNMYGTSVKAVEDVAKDGKICLLEIDVQGAESIKTLGMEARFVFITTSGDTLSILTDRLQNRGSESKEQVAKRLSAAKRELKFLDDNPEFFDFVLENDDLEEAYKRLLSKLGSWYQLKPSI